MVAAASRIPGHYLPGTRPVWWKSSFLWQARLWLPREHGGAVSLGLHHSMRAANRFFERVRERFDAAAKSNPDPLALIAWQSAVELWDTSLKPCGLLPKWVRSCRDEFGDVTFEGRVRVNGVVMTGPARLSPREAFVAFWPAIQRHLPEIDEDGPKPIRRTFDRPPRFVYPSLPGM